MKGGYKNCSLFGRLKVGEKTLSKQNNTRSIEFPGHCGAVFTLTQ
jgi:hypothetical protein